ncbi:LOW QUALITY PROTEIN: hypothetical protein PHMEG_0008992 [Phytophthora megakarya]|uniref:Uncharacterized protein n=1 Tax=Phytophthora megakarya TaxID=4795 RepID=A0A225WJ11_9STRA|nr:LOW QUALITY PROTEIN: hypothetical protein PHMEG_0008992 [Phytophthora megakarya]
MFLDDEIRWLANKQHFLLDPHLALPRSFVFGDGQICGDGGEEAEARISGLLEDYPRAKEIAACSQLVKDHASGSTSIWAYAACGHIILNTKSKKVFFSSLRELRALNYKIFIKRSMMLLFGSIGSSFLIPELVRNREMIPLCQKCNGDPRNNKFSVAAGHAYGRIGNLPALNEVGISPAACFGLELSLSGKHSSGHAICFPTNGARELARVLPNVGNRSEGTSPDANVPSEDLVMCSSIVLPQVEQSEFEVVHGIIDAMVSAVAGETDAQCQDTVVLNKRDTRLLSGETMRKYSRVCFQTYCLLGPDHCRRTHFPVITASTLCGQFDIISQGLLEPLQVLESPTAHYWDGRFEKSVTITAMLFNQMHRHAVVLKAARESDAEIWRVDVYLEVQTRVRFQKANPESKEASLLNVGLLRLLSLVGGSVPISPFERAATRPTLAAMRFRYGIALHWVTVALPEHDNLLLHRISYLRSVGNDCHGNVCSDSYRFENLPEQIQNDTRSQLRVSTFYPELAAQAFERRIKLLTDFIIWRSASSETRTSSNYFEPECSVYGRRTAFIAVKEPQKDGRLHVHRTVYGSSIKIQIVWLESLLLTL